VQHLDLVPTLVELAQLDADGLTLGGRSLAPMLLDESAPAPARDSLYFEYGYARAIRKGDWKYIAVRYPEGTRERLNCSVAIFSDWPRLLVVWHYCPASGAKPPTTMHLPGGERRTGP